MFSDDLQEARKVLLKGGVSPWYVKRIIDELRDHHADIRDALVRQGCSHEEASLAAVERVGDLKEISRETLGKPELKSFISLWPKTIFLLGPVLLFPAVAAAMACVMVLKGRGWVPGLPSLPLVAT